MGVEQQVFIHQLLVVVPVLTQYFQLLHQQVAETVLRALLQEHLTILAVPEDQAAVEQEQVLVEQVIHLL